MSSEKSLLRERFKAQRKGLSEKRRAAGTKALKETLLPKLSSFNHVLSFASAFDEIDTAPINQTLMQEGKLILPRVFSDELKLYIVSSLDELETGAFGILEPKESCPNIEIDLVEGALVPGLAFDNRNYRLGYGKGFYDKLLAKLNAVSFGVGFIEQKSLDPLPKDAWDKPVSEVVFV